MSVESAFAPFLEPATMRGLLATHLPPGPGGPARVRDVQVLHAWRKTWARAENARRAYLVVSYSVAIESADRTGFEQLLLQGRADLAVERDAASSATGVPGLQDPVGAWPLRLRTPLASLELRRFPDDAALPQLAALHARRSAPGIAQELWPRVVSYRPGARCTLAFEDAAGRARAYAKTFADPRVAAAVAARLEAVGTAVRARQASRLQVPGLLALEAPTATVWTGALDGVAVRMEAGGGAGHAWDAAGTQETLAMALADLHDAPVPGLAPATREQRLREAARKLRKLSQRLPQAAADATRAIARCESLLRQVEAAQVPLDVPRHGDVHPGQFRLCGGRVALFDFDELALGDAEEDLAALAVALEVAAFGTDTARDAAGAAVWPGPGRAARLLPRITAAHASGRSGRRALHEPLLEFHLRLQWIDRAYRSEWRDGGRLRGLVELALRRAEDPGFASRPGGEGATVRADAAAGARA